MGAWQDDAGMAGDAMADEMDDQLYRLITEAIREITDWQANWSSSELGRHVADAVLAAGYKAWADENLAISALLEKEEDGASS